MAGEIQKSPGHCTFHFMFKSKELLFPEPPPLVKNVPSPSHNAKKKKLKGSRKEVYDYNFLHSKIPGTPNNLMGNPEQLKPKQ